MGIKFYDDKKIFALNTKNTSYQMQIGKFGHLLHLYYGKRTEDTLDYLVTLYDRGFSGNPYEAGCDTTYSLDSLPQEYPSYGTGDYRMTALCMQNAEGTFSCDLRYQGYEIKNGLAIPERAARLLDDKLKKVRETEMKQKKNKAPVEKVEKTF